jgi:hypothetical protein
MKKRNKKKKYYSPSLEKASCLSMSQAQKVEGQEKSQECYLHDSVRAAHIMSLLSLEE